MRQAHANAEGGAGVVSADEGAERAGEHFAEDDRGGNHENRGPIINEHLGIDQQANGKRRPQASTRRDHNRANHECAEGNAVFELRREKRDAEAQSEDRDEQHLIALELCHVTDQPRDADQTNDEQHGEKDSQFAESQSHFADAQSPCRGDAGQQRDHGDAQNVFDDQNAEHQLSEMFPGFSEFAERFDNNCCRRN